MQEQKSSTTEFDHLPTKDDLSALYRKKEENDPASLHYERHLTRPSLRPFRVLSLCLLILALASIAGFGAQYVFETVLLSVLVGLLIPLLTVLVFFKHVLIWLIKCYQRFAPDKIRNRCRFEPSCSDYMILSLQKHGAIKGLTRGIRRLFRCKPPYGGFDFP